MNHCTECRYLVVILLIESIARVGYAGEVTRQDSSVIDPDLVNLFYYSDVVVEGILTNRKDIVSEPTSS
jgi:hypothetical protein